MKIFFIEKGEKAEIKLVRDISIDFSFSINKFDSIYSSDQTLIPFGDKRVSLSLTLNSIDEEIPYAAAMKALGFKQFTSSFLNRLWEIWSLSQEFELEIEFTEDEGFMDRIKLLNCYIQDYTPDPFAPSNVSVKILARNWDVI